MSREKSQTGAHTKGRAFDIYVESRERDLPKLLRLAHNHGFTRAGIQLSLTRWKLHLDDMTQLDGFAARPDGDLFCWTYE
jgi:hypothetical protein